MTIELMRENDDVLIRARITLVHAHSCEVLLPEVGGARLAKFGYPSIFKPRSTDGVTLSIQQLLAEIDKANGVNRKIGARVIAELLEWGSHTMSPAADPGSRSG